MASWHRPAYLTATACLVGLLAFQTLIVVKRAGPKYRVALGLESRKEYLRRHEPSFEIAEFVNQYLPADSRLLTQDYRCLYFHPATVREDAMRRRFPYREQGWDLVRKLSAEGYTHILLVQAHNAEIAAYDQTFTHNLGEAVAGLKIVHTTHFDGPTGDSRDYQLLEIPPPGHNGMAWVGGSSR